MTHPDSKKVKHVETPYESREWTDLVYNGEDVKWDDLTDTVKSFDPAPPIYNAYIGDVHGHTDLSDGWVDIDTHFRHLKYEAKLDFAALTDHDHGGVGNAELWKYSPSKWDLIKSKNKEYYEPNKFTTILAYERDSYPYYPNLIVYYNNHDGEMLRSERDGEINEDELKAALSRDDILLIPHDTYYFPRSVNFAKYHPELFVSLLEVCSDKDCAEYYGNAGNSFSYIKGGFWQDALNAGAKMGCVGGSDSHSGTGGNDGLGLTGVWAKENTVEGIFEALKARRTYAFIGSRRVVIDFRINGHYMGEEFKLRANEDRCVWLKIDSEVPVKYVTVVKNCNDYIRLVPPEATCQYFVDYDSEKNIDSYYLRVELEDGRFAWTSPIWIERI